MKKQIFQTIYNEISISNLKKHTFFKKACFLFHVFYFHGFFKKSCSLFSCGFFKKTMFSLFDNFFFQRTLKNVFFISRFLFSRVFLKNHVFNGFHADFLKIMFFYLTIFFNERSRIRSFSN